MDFADLRAELSEFYNQKCDALAEQCKKDCDSYLNNNMPDNITAFEMKQKQYRIIAERVTPPPCLLPATFTTRFAVTPLMKFRKLPECGPIIITKKVP